MHSSSNLKDGYMGSGKRLRYSIKKYGIENFTCEILEFFNTREKLILREKELITNELISDTKCLNIRLGGDGGFYYCNIARMEKLRSDAEYKTKMSKIFSESNKVTPRGWNVPGANRAHFLGKHHNPETIVKMRNSAKGKHVGDKNSQFGTKWITNSIESKKIKKLDPVPHGWYLGRHKLIF